MLGLARRRRLSRQQQELSCPVVHPHPAPSATTTRPCTLSWITVNSGAIDERIDEGGLYPQRLREAADDMQRTFAQSELGVGPPARAA